MRASIHSSSSRQAPCSSRGQATVVCGATSTDQRRALNAFSAWAIERKVQFGGVRPDAKDDWRGLYATLPLAVGQQVVAVPRTSCIWLTTTEGPPDALSSGNNSKEQVQKVWSQLPWWARLAAKVCLLEGDVAARPYLDILPADLDLPALWADRDLQRAEARAASANGAPDSPVEALQVPYTIAKVRAEQRQWRQAAALLAPLLAPRGVAPERVQWALAVVRSRSFEAPTFRVPTGAKAGLAVALPLLAAASQAASGDAAAGLLDLEVWAPALASLAVPAALTSWDLKNSSKETTYAIPPFIDLLNHSSSAQTEVGYDWVRDTFYVSSGAFYAPGSQVFISYGELSNDALLQLYGFVEPNNEHDRYIMADLSRWLASSSALQHAASGSLPTASTASTDGDEAGGAAVAAAPEVPEWKARRLREAVGKLGAGGLLTEVEVRRSGFPGDVMEACMALSRAALRLRHLQSPEEEQQQRAPYEPSAASVVALTAQALSEACAEELAALGTSVEEDELELQRAKRMERLAQQPAPAAPEAPTPPTPPQPPPSHDALAAERQEAQQAGQEAPLTVAAVEAVEASSSATAASSGVAVLTATQEEAGAAEEAVREYQRQLEQYERRLEEHAVEAQRHERRLQQHRLELAEWREAAAVGAVGWRRLGLAVAYRLEKKRVLVEGMGAVVAWMKQKLGR